MSLVLEGIYGLSEFGPYGLWFRVEGVRLRVWVLGVMV